MRPWPIRFGRVSRRSDEEYGWAGGPKDPWYRVVGVISDIKNGGLEKPAGTELFASYRAPEAERYDYYIALKTVSDPRLAAGEIRRIVSTLDPSLPISKVRTMDDVISGSRSRSRFLTTVLTIFSLLALALATLGSYGVIAYSVEQRTSEFGIRMALGAEPRRLLLGVVRQGLLLGVIGICVGLVFSWLLTSSLRGLTFGVSGFDAQSFMVTAVLLVVVSVAASAVPALRAVSIEPVNALRYE